MAGLDMEDENVLKIIFPSEGGPQPDGIIGPMDRWRWGENPEVCQYVRELSSFGLERIRREPQQAREEAEAVLEQTQDLVFNNYKTFIHAAECSKEIFKDFKLVEGRLDSVSERLPDFVEKCRQFQQTSRDIAASRRLNSLTLQRHSQLLEVLEMPQLMDTCVRNGYHEEALRLAAHVARLARGKAGTAPAMQAVAREVRAGVRLLAARLLRQLRSEAVQLPACLRIVGHLRGTGAFGEDELRLKFLQARDVWFQGILDAVPSADPYQHVTKVIEVSRVHLFDVTTQFRAIFSVSDEPDGPVGHQAQHSAAILHSWIARRVGLFLDVLERDLARGVGNSLDSLLNQCMYFGLSFGRIGADFRGLMAALFERAAMTNFERSVEMTTSRFASAMQSHVATNTTAPRPTNDPRPSEDLQPPTVLLEFTPLAELCNGLLSAMDDLRPLVALSSVADVTRRLQVALQEASQAIADYHRAEEAGLTERERDSFARLVEGYARHLVPHLDRCLRALFSRQQLAQVLGVTVAELNRMDALLGRLDANVVLETVAYLLPDPSADVGGSIDEPQEGDPPTEPNPPRGQPAVTNPPSDQSPDPSSDKLETSPPVENLPYISEILSPEQTAQSKFEVGTEIKTQAVQKELDDNEKDVHGAEDGIDSLEQASDDQLPTVPLDVPPSGVGAASVEPTEEREEMSVTKETEDAAKAVAKDISIDDDKKLTES